VITLDLDNFKGVNDTYGHDRGDQILIEIAGFLLQRIRAIDAVVRLGGDEFVILLTDADSRDVDGLVERLQHEAIAAPCAFSMGSALRQQGEALSATIARADAAMYGAKNAKRQA
jgi:diguanylate cyclase (GGDEF)-like protein